MASEREFPHRIPQRLLPPPVPWRKHGPMRIGQAIALTAMLMATACNQDRAAPAPVATAAHVAQSRGCTFARAAWTISSGPSPESSGTAAKNVAELDRDSHLYWNEAPIDASTLRLYTNTVTEIRPQPLTILRADPRAECELFQSVIADITAAANCAPSTCILEWTPLPHDPRRPQLPPSL
ncbi:MAG: hypothetical protein V4472_21490 [Pseudomonadota bacterium]